LLEEKDELFPAAMKVADEGADLSADPAVVLDLAASSRTAEPRARTPSTVAFLDDSHRRSDGVMEEMVSATSIKPPNAEGLTEGSRQQDQGGEGMLEARTPVSYTRARTRTRSDETLAKSYLSPLQHEEPRRSDSKRHSDRHSDRYSAGTEDGNTALADVASHFPPGSEAPAQHLAIQEAVGTIVDTIVVQDEETRQDTHKDIPDEHGEMSELRTAPVLTPAREVPKDQPTKEESKESSAEEATLVNVQVIAASEVNREVNVATEEAAGDESTQEAKHVDHVDTETAADSGHHEPAEEKHSEHVAAEAADAERVAAEEAEAVRVAAEEADAERVASEEAGAVRVAAEEAEAVRVAAEEAEAVRVAAEEAEAVRVAAAEYAEAEEARRRGPSAVKIQSRARGKRGRKKAKQRAEATETIQAHARGGAARKKTNPMREKKRAEEARKRVAAEKAEAERLKAVRLAENAEAARLKAETSKLEAEQAEAKAATGGATAKRVATQKRLVADKVGEAADKEGEAAAAHAAVMARKQERAAKKEAARLEWIAQQGSGESAR
jgi:chemosensory pili system protein ChpA (sensor histidine kinase/response regulator)